MHPLEGGRSIGTSEADSYRQELVASGIFNIVFGNAVLRAGGVASFPYQAEDCDVVVRNVEAQDKRGILNSELRIEAYVPENINDPAGEKKRIELVVEKNGEPITIPSLGGETKMFSDEQMRILKEIARRNIKIGRDDNS